METFKTFLKMSEETKKATVAFVVAGLSVAVGVALGMTLYTDVVKRWVIKK